MAVSDNRQVGPWLYGALFVVIVPILLVAWARATGPIVPLPAPGYPWVGWCLGGFGLLLLLLGMGALRTYGRGLPMNAYPPSVYVSEGVYRFIAHPIYLGFVLLWFGGAIVTASGSGFWLVAPAVALGCGALVLGYERHDLRRRFGILPRPLLALPPSSDEPPSGWHRLAVFALVLVPWAAAYEAVYLLGIPPDAVEAYFAFERGWPVFEWTEIVYGSVYVFVPAALLLATTNCALRRFAVTGLIATVVVTLIYLTVPVTAPPRPFDAHTFLGRALQFERTMSNTVAAFPAFHVIWSLIAADAWASRSRTAGTLAWAWTGLIAASCITTGMHALLDVAFAFVIFAFLRAYRGIWEGIRHIAEVVANSWREWQFGKVRVLNHGAYAGLAGAVGFTIAVTFAGPDVFWQLVVVHVAGLLGAGLWAQTLEGSSKLSRPFGYYGSVIGAVAGAIVAGLVGGNTMLLLAAIALEAPWMQAIGRARCLVQGCCHGFQTTEQIGIRYWRDRSRVVTLAELRGVPLHPTPVYSMLTNIVTGVLLLRLWSLGAPLSMIAGAYLILGGVARFVEESYRGEPQTMVFGGLRIYQWLAIISFAAGAVLTALPSAAASGLALWLDTSVPVAAVLFGGAAGFAMGVDFPQATGRFTRLAPPACAAIVGSSGDSSRSRPATTIPRP
jgi:protein-S-isoprenylcysteine O-methyltransferase Ste14